MAIGGSDTGFTDLTTDAGTWKAGIDTLSGAEASASGGLDIDTGLSSITVCIVQIYRSGVLIFSDQGITTSAGVITVTDGGATYELTAGDVVHWIAVGTL